jgi:sec-independent protein translocase protein TatC
MSVLSRVRGRRSVTEGRSAAGALVASARRHLQKVFVAFLVGLFGTIYAMRLWVWEFLRNVTTRGMSAATADQLEIIVRTPFDVILLQVKLGMAVGAVFAAVVVLYYARTHLSAQDLWPALPVSRRVAASVALLSLGLFVGGVAYGYHLFFPVMFAFLTDYAIGAGFVPTYDLVAWTEFILLLTLSFGLAAQLPLAMVGLALLEVVPYETFRQKWRHAVVGIFVFGAVFSPPDPFTQLLWAIPLVGLYGVSLFLTRVAVTLSRSASAVDFRGALRAAWLPLVAGPVVVAAATYGLWQVPEVRRAWQTLLQELPFVADYETRFVAVVGSPEAAVAVVAGVLGIVTLVALVVRTVSAAVASVDPVLTTRDVRSLDFATLDPGTVRALPLRSFATLDGQAMLDEVKQAMKAGDRELAEALLARYDEARDAGYTPPAKSKKSKRAKARSSATDGGVAADVASYSDGAKRGTAGFASVLFEEDVSEDDVGGYYHEIVAIVSTLQSSLTRIIAAFSLTMTAVFAVLYMGGVGAMKADFLSRVPADVVPAEAVRIVALHPVEVLVFAVKLSVFVGVLATLPVVVYSLWPALVERDLVPVQTRTLRTWAVGIGGSLLGGSVVGYLFVAPTVISYLAYDAIRAGAVVSYRVDAFFWLVFLTTGFVGLLAAVPTAMYLAGRGGLVRYETLRESWRVAVVALFVLGAVATPKGVVSMVVVAVPLAFAYLLGLAVLRVDRVFRRPGRGKPTRTAP